jgi:hypothetical protein
VRLVPRDVEVADAEREVDGVDVVERAGPRREVQQQAGERGGQRDPDRSAGAA